MRGRGTVGISLAVLVAALMLVPAGIQTGSRESTGPASPDDLDRGTVNIDLDTGGLSAHGWYFTMNEGQLGAGAGRFYSQGDTVSVAFARGWMAYDIDDPDQSGEGALVKVEFVDGAPIMPVGRSPVDVGSNYFKGSNPTDWVTGLISYRQVVYEDLWDGTDLEFYFSDGKLKYDLEISPKADVSNARFSYTGCTGVEIDPSNGDLLIGTAAGIIREDAPIAHYSDDPWEGIECGFHIGSGGVVSFTLAEHDPSRPVTIDPGIVFSTLIGGTEADEAMAIDVDDDGNIYLLSSSESQDFPTTPGAYITPENTSRISTDIFISKFNPNCSDLIYSAWVGSSSMDVPVGLKVDDSGSVYVVCKTNGRDFPITPGAYCSTSNWEDGGSGYDVTAFKLDADGSALLYSTYFGGEIGYSDGAMDIDGDGNVYYCGNTRGDWPTTPGAYIEIHHFLSYCFLTKLNPTGSDLVYSTYTHRGESNDIVVDDEGHAYVTGVANGEPFPDSAFAFDKRSGPRYNSEGCVFKVTPDGSDIILGTMIGESGRDQGYCLEVDADGCPILAGSTQIKGDFPTTPGAMDRWYNGGVDIWVAKFSNDFERLLFSTFLGSPEDDRVYDIAIDEDGNTYVLGDTVSNKFPTTLNAYDTRFSQNVEIFLSKLDANGTTLLYSTFIGEGDDNEDYESPEGLFCLGVNDLLVCGETLSDEFPVTQGAYQTSLKGSSDAFLTRIQTDDVSDHNPGPPKNTTGEGGDSVATLSWDLADNNPRFPNTGYTVYRHDAGLGYIAIGRTDRAETSHDDPNLVNGRTYRYYVTTTNVIGESEPSPVITVIPLGTPTVPRSLTAEPGDARVRVSWDTPINDGGTSLLGYIVSRGTEGGPIDRQVYVGSDTEVLDTDVVNGIEYSYTVIAFNAVGNSTRASVGYCVPVGPPTVPMELTVVGTLDRTVELRWLVPENEGGRDVLGYDLFRGVSGTGLTFLSALSLQTDYTDREVLNGFTYHYAIRARNELGHGPLTGQVEATPLAPPGRPRALGIDTGHDLVDLTWSPPFKDGGVPVATYLVYRWVGEEQPGLLAEVSTASYMDEDVTDGRSYYYAVSASNGQFEGAMTVPVIAVPLGAPGAPTLTTILAGDGYVSISWRRPDDDGGGHVIVYSLYRSVDGGEMELLTEVGPSHTMYTDHDLDNGLEHAYAISASNMRFEGPLSGQMTSVPRGLPDAPGSLTFAPADGRITVSWQPPDDDGGAEVTGYVIFRGLTEIGLITVSTVNGATEFVDGSLTPGLTYHYAIAAVNDAGMGKPSHSRSTMLPSVPTPPRGLVAEEKGDKVTLTWRDPSRDGGSPITGYIVLMGSSVETLQVKAELDSVLNHTFVVKRGKDHYFAVVAVNDQGESVASQTVLAHVEEEGVPGPGLPLVIFTLLATAMLVRTRRRNRR